MAKITKEQIIETIGEMTILELNEVVEAMKEAFGVDPSAVAVAGPAQAAEETGPVNVTLTLTEAGSSKLGVIKLIREVTGLGLKEAKEIADNGGAVKENFSSDEAAELKARFEEAGATVEVK